MDIQQLTLVVTEADLTKFAVEYIEKHKHPVDKITVSISPDGVTIKGEVTLFMPMKFETLWEPSVGDGKSQARLAKVNAMGMGGSLFKNALQKIIEEMIKKEPGLDYSDGTIIADVSTLAAQEGLTVQIYLQSIRCETGLFVVTAVPGPA